VDLEAFLDVGRYLVLIVHRLALMDASHLPLDAHRLALMDVHWALMA
jgi:hypothetical protein